MPCLCTVNTLKFFIRSIVQADPFAVATRPTPAQLRKTPARNFTAAREIRSQHSYRTSGFSSRSSGNHIPFERGSPKAHHSPKKWSVQTSSTQNNGQVAGHVSDPDIESPFLEISPQAIDALSTESDHQTSFETNASTLESTPKKALREGTVSAPPSRTTFRRTKVQNTSLAIHFSAPRAPLKSALARQEDPMSVGERSEESAKKKDWTPPKRENWQIQKEALKRKFPEKWKPLKRLSPDALAGIRALHTQMPEQYTTAALATSFEVSPEAIRRILKSKWVPNQEEEINRQERWFNRGVKIWSRYAELGMKPPRIWQELGIGAEQKKKVWAVRKARKKAAKTTAPYGDRRMAGPKTALQMGDSIYVPDSTQL